MGMFAVKKCIYSIVASCFLMVSLSFHLWADEGSRKSAPSEPQKSENAQNPDPKQDQPQISLDSTKYDAGEVGEGSEVVHDFTVKNTGTAELNISRVKAG